MTAIQQWHPMSPADHAWLRMDRPTNHMVVNTVMWFDEPLDADRVRNLISSRLVARYPRFSQRPAERGGLGWWVGDREFDLDHHLHLVTLPPPGDRHELERFIGARLQDPLPAQRPLWQVYLIAGYNNRGSVLFSRIHHSVADGVALTRLLLSLRDGAPDQPLGDAEQFEEPDDRPPDPISGAGRRVGRLGSAALDLITRPTRVFGLPGAALAEIRAAGKLLLLPPDRRNALHRPVGTAKQVAWTDPIPLADVKAAAHAASVTVNDLSLAAVTGALRAELARRSGRLPDIRAMIPVNLRPLDRPLDRNLGNKFGLVYLTLPTSVDDRGERLSAIHKRMADIKVAPEAMLSYEVLQATGLMPAVGEDVMISLFSAKATVVITNVHGPDEAIFLAGRKLRGTIGWPPESGNLGLGVAITSYDGELTLGALADVELFPDARGLIELARTELDMLVDLCRSRSSGSPSP